MTARQYTMSRAQKLFLTVWIIYCVHFSSNVVRETYLAVSLGERLSVRVDEYLGLHPDLFEIQGRGAYINNNPGASVLGAIPYALARPALSMLFSWKPSLLSPKPPAEYDDPRPNRTKFMNAARARGLDIKLGLAALVMQVGLMAPLGGLAAVLVFFFFQNRLRREETALWIALLYAFATPVFFRSAFLNQNLIIAHIILLAYIGMVGLVPRPPGELPNHTRLLGVGILLGSTIFTDYSGIPLVLAFGFWILALGWRRRGAGGALTAGLRYSAGVLLPIAALFGYQWIAFGNPFLPAQTYMPETPFSVQGWNGFTMPTGKLLGGNLVDPRYGLFAFCPLLLAGLAAPFLKKREYGPSNDQLALILGAFVALYLFTSATQFATLQWNTGVRYLVPAVPLLFVATVPVLLRMPRLLMYALVIPTLAISWAVSMTREAVPRALLQIFTTGFELPVLTVLRKMSSGYLPGLAGGVTPVPLFCLLGVIVWLLWRRTDHSKHEVTS